MMKKVISILMIGLFLFGIGQNVSATETKDQSFYLKADKSFVEIGDTVTISLYSESDYKELSTVFFRIDYDENKFSIDKKESSIAELGKEAFVVDNSYGKNGKVTGVTAIDFENTDLTISEHWIADFKFVAEQTVEDAEFKILKAELCDDEYEIKKVSTSVGDVIKVDVTKTDGTSSDVTEVFGDISDNAWYVKEVQYVYDKKLMQGSNGLFKPTNHITRAQFVTTLYRLAGEPEVSDKRACIELADVREGEYYTDAICWAYNNEITTGKNGIFDVNGNLTRQQMATFFFRFAEVCGYDTSARGDYSIMLNAAQVSEYAKDAMSWTVGTGLISGSKKTDANGTTVYDLNPTGNTTRAQLAAILQRFCLANNL